MVLSLILSNVPVFLLLVGAGLIIMEAFAPGAHFFVAGVALFAAGAVGILLPAGMATALVFFIMTAVVLLSAIGTLYVYRELDVYGGTSKGKTTDSASLRGETGRVTKEVTQTEGEVKLNAGGFNPFYQARSLHGDIEEGQEVIVVDPGGGNVLTVTSISDLEDDIDRELERDRQLTEREKSS